MPFVRTVPIREQRLGSCIAHGGTYGCLNRQIGGKCLKKASRSFNQATVCQEWYSMFTLFTVQDSVSIIHAPVGCAASGACMNVFNRCGQAVRGKSRIFNAKWVATDLNESDIIHGGEKKLRQTVKEVDERYGPLEWRLPEAHSIYWAAMGLKKAAENPTKVKEDDLITLRRVIYQSMQMSFQRGRLVTNPFAKSFEFGPNLDIIPKVNNAYEQAAREDAKNHDHILKAHRNFLRDAVYFLYVYNRLPDAAQWFKYLATNYPDKTLIDNNTNSFPANLTLEKYAVARVQDDISTSGGRDRTEGVLEGLLVNSYRSMVLAEDAAAAGFKLLARQVWMAYQSGIPEVRMAAVGLRPFEEIDQEVRRRMLDSKTGEPPEVRALLRAKLGQPPEPSTPPSTTNGPPEKASSQ